MKLAIFLLLNISSLAFAQDFQFVTPGHDKALTFKAQAADIYTAQKIAAEECFDHFTQGQGVSDEYGENVINMCTNMRQK